MLLWSCLQNNSKARMPKGRVLSASEREEIVRMHAAGASAREIGKQLERSKTVVLNFLKAPAQYAQIKRSGRKRALSGDDERRLFAAITQRMALPGGAGSPRQDTKRSAEQIRREFNVPLSTRRIQQLLSEWRREARRAQDLQQEHETAVAESAGVDAGEVAVDALMPTADADQPASSDSASAQPAAQAVETEPSTHADTIEQPQDSNVIALQEPSAVPPTTGSPAPPSPEGAAIEV